MVETERRVAGGRVGSWKRRVAGAILWCGVGCVLSGAGDGVALAQQGGAGQAVAPVDAGAQGLLGAQIAGLLAGPEVARAHWGIDVVGMDGAPVFALNEGQFFQPASNAKLFTTAAALGLLGAGRTFETRVLGRGVFTGSARLRGDVVMVGDGDANLSGQQVPYAEPVPGVRRVEAPALRYLEAMADAVAATGLKVVNGDVVGDDTVFPWEPYAADWTIDDAVWGYGAPVSALMVNENQVKITVTAGGVAGMAATVAMDPVVSYYAVDASELRTGVAKSGSHVGVDRAMGSKMLRVFGTIGVDAPPEVEEVAIDDPAEYAAMALKGMLEERGVVVTGVARAEHRRPVDTEGFLKETREPIEDVLHAAQSFRVHGEVEDLVKRCEGCEASLAPSAQGAVEKMLAVHDSPTLGEDVVVTNKESENLHAELLLHQLGAAVGTGGSTAQGARVVRAFTVQAGVDPGEFVLYDGSGLSGHDLVTARAVVTLLTYAAEQPWFAGYKASLPVGGVDGTLEGRFVKSPVKGHVFAKTGTLGEARALSGYLECRSGRMVVFSILVGNHAPGTSADRVVMDKIVEAVWASN
jgi:serine-type D-Ala-D-Ala carboxypeptidase/endopeptidase (penicillin-binding protein 4)